MNNLRYYIRRHKAIRRSCKLLLNLSILTLLGVLIWLGVLLFSGQFMRDQLAGSLVFIAVLVAFGLLCRVGLQNHWKPSMKLTVISLVGLFVIFSFAGVQPLAEYKDICVDKITDYYNEANSIWNDNVGTGNSENGAVIDVSFEYIFNTFREANALQPLVFTDDLNRVATLRLGEIKVNFRHESIGEYNLHLGENIAMRTGYLSDSQAFAMWENSFGHKANMVDSSYQYTGYANGNGYAIQVFSQFETIDGVPLLPPDWYWVD